MKKFYLTNAIAYVNAPPHIGHALELLQGDALTRYHRLLGEDTRFLVGTDEHGTKVEQTARAKGMEPQQLADENSEHFRRLNRIFGSAEDDFIRTTSDLHKRGAQKLWKKIEAAGVLYEKEYEGLYCTGCEAFLLEKDLDENGFCPTHKRAPEKLNEKNIFFRLSDYNEILREKIESDELLIRPESRKNEILALIKEGLQDVSFSRPKKSLSWGVEVPGHEDQVMYVWCDALSNYLTALGYADDDALVERYWPADVHLIGKDITRFHCCIWPAMLLAADVPLPKAVFAHGFVTSEGQKMSKSIGNVVDPFVLVDEFGVDAVRYYLLREIPTGDDGDFSRERFLALYRDELQNTLGNLMRRVMAMTEKYLQGEVPEANGALLRGIEGAQTGFDKGMQNFNIKAAIEAILELAREANAYVENQKPWALAKENPELLKPVLGNLLAACRAIATLLRSILPEKAEEMLRQLGDKKVNLGEALFPPLIEPLDSQQNQQN